jgi:galactosamine-6-phosphate isomerase
VRIIDCEDYEALSVQAALIVISEITQKRNLLLCAATGNSPIGLYDALVRKAQTDSALFDALRIIQLDEWGGLSENGPGSCERYLRTRLLDPLGISPARFIGFAAAAREPEEECRRIRSALARDGPIDVCVLGLGINGHIGFNEPGPVLLPQCHVARLSDDSRRHAMVGAMNEAPRFGLTLGLQEILAARRILLLVTGEGKQQALAGLLSGEVSTTLPASFLWLHGNADCLIDQGALVT